MQLVRSWFASQGLRPDLAVKAPNPNHWTVREVPIFKYK